MPITTNMPRFVKRDRRWAIENFRPPGAVLSYPRIQHQKTFIYVIECAGLFKIGLAKNLSVRLATFETGNPLPLKTFAFRRVPAISATLVESWLHQHFAKSRLRGEWFALNPAEIRPALKMALRHGRTYDEHCRDFYFKSSLGDPRQRPQSPSPSVR